MSREEIEQVEKELDEVLEIVQMVGLDVVHDGDGGGRNSGTSRSIRSSP